MFRPPLRVVALALIASVAPACAVPSGAVAERKAASVILRNGHCRLELSSRTGEIVSLSPGPASLKGSWLEAVVEDRRGMQHWETWKHGAEKVFSSGPAEVSWRTNRGTAWASVTWRPNDGLRLVADIRLRAADAGPMFRVTVHNASGAALVDTLRLPVLSGITLGRFPDDDWFTWPHTLGSRFRVQGLKPAEMLTQPYPGFLTMQWLDLFDEEEGVYVGCLDAYGVSKSLTIGRSADGRSRMGVQFEGCWVASAGDRWTTPWVQIAAHRGDWRAGADLYRPFAQKAFGPVWAPERIREMPTAQCWLAHHGSDGDIGKLFEIQQQAPIHASYLMKSLNTSTPEGWDGMRGSGLEYKRAFRKIKELGGSAALFTFDRAPLMGKPNYAEHAQRWLCRRRDGSFNEGFRDMMPSPFDPAFVEARIDEALRWVRNFGLDEMHYDTEATTGESMLAGPSYEPGSGRRPNEVPHAFKQLYRKTIAACRKVNPSFTLRAEHLADFWYPEFSAGTAHFLSTGTGTLVKAHNPPVDAQLLPILLRYTLPRHAAFQMPSMGNSDFWMFGYGMGHGFHGGGPSWCFNPGVRDTESPPGSLDDRYRFYEDEWRRFYDFRVGFEEAVVDAEWSDVVTGPFPRLGWPPSGLEGYCPWEVTAVVSGGDGREVTLGEWNPKLMVSMLGREVPGPSNRPGPIVLNIPTRLVDPSVRLLGPYGKVSTGYSIYGSGRRRTIRVSVADPTWFAVEVSEGPILSLAVAKLAHPGEPTRVTVKVEQSKPVAGTLEVGLPAGWPRAAPVRVPAVARFTRTVTVTPPRGLFGRNYPVKAVFKWNDGRPRRRTTAAHLLVIEPVTVMVTFGGPNSEPPHYAEPGRDTWLTVTCVNNTAKPLDLKTEITGEGIRDSRSSHLNGVDLHAILGPPSRASGGSRFRCTGVLRKPIRVRVTHNGQPVFDQKLRPRVRVMDLNGDWRVHLTPVSRATVGGAERLDALDTEAVTPDVWDGNWATHRAPFTLDARAHQDNSWGIYRRLVFIPTEWQGTDVWLRLERTGAPWGEGGTLNLVYVNGWPAGRMGWTGECRVSPLFVFGGWNLIAVASTQPNCLIDPYLFVRESPAPERIKPAPTGDVPAGAFLRLDRRCSGQGITMPFVQGVAEDGHRRTNLAEGGENQFLYFAVADGCVKEPAAPVEVEIEYLDDGTGEVGLDYDSKDASAPVQGAFMSAPPFRRTNSGEWRKHVFVLPDARLANRQHMGSDFRLYGRGSDLAVRWVGVRVRRM